MNWNVPGTGPVCEALGFSAVIVTVGASWLAIDTVPENGPPMAYAPSLSARMTVSVFFATPLSVGTTVMFADDWPAGMTTDPVSARSWSR